MMWSIKLGKCSITLFINYISTFFINYIKKMLNFSHSMPLSKKPNMNPPPKFPITNDVS